MRFRSIFTFFLLLEIASLIALGVLAGFWPTLAVVVGTGFLGSALLRSPGRRISGVLLMIPGLLTDLLGLVLLLPAPRRWSAALAKAWFLRGVPTGAFQRVVWTAASAPPGGFPHEAVPPGAMPPTQGGVVQAEVLEVKPSERPALEAE